MPTDDDPAHDDTALDDAPATRREAPGLGVAPTQVSELNLPVVQLGKGTIEGYEVKGAIGQGGMGEVVLAADLTIKREVALKRLHANRRSPPVVSRFLREARIQARLEHPGIVPVYALGQDAAGSPFFTMKRLDGVTLAERFGSSPAPSMQELLRILVDVARAIELAHARGVVHRDLKPANIMLGTFGEVYVLDWGIARVLAEASPVAEAGDVPTLDGLTQAGALIGTPGYMSPEQAIGSEDVGPPADVYALGVILFEILAGERLHGPGAGPHASAKQGVDGSPRHRAPERAIPPELDALCVEALALDPSQRPRVATFADRIQRYLDGDRDHDRRRELAKAELESARRALESGDEARRPEAIRAAGRSLALSPESREAAALIAQLILEPPREHPPALAARLAESDAAVQRRQGRAAVLALSAVLVFLAAAAVNGVRDWFQIGGIAAFTGIVAILAGAASRRAASPRSMWLVAIGNAVLAALLSRVFGPLILAPVVTCTMAVSLTSYPQLMAHRIVVIGLLIGTYLTPIALEAIGVLASTWEVREGSVVSRSSAVEIGGHATEALLIGSNVLAIAVIGLFASALARARRAAQRDSEIQAWQLRHLLPEGP